ncbi:carboxypeptidase-like regulatory domain-containing protein, partial [Winogradskyella sp.]|uniref:carboxypeptidase-like regulatory domain-containing protein n=1 Tax=Winogradskyella sp. TaxID=1883156 RepID=UPI0025CD1AF1
MEATLKNNNILSIIISRLFVLIATLFTFTFAQEITVFGKISDSLNNPLQYASILAIPQTDDLDVTFAITEADGSYMLGLAKKQSYELTVSFLGYTSQKLTLATTDKDVIKDFVLQENSEALDEITINYTPPISVKKDTITYDVSKFVTGEERKLRDALKRLPGVEVDRAGNVTVQGKKVTKVLVEDKTFFTGNSKLA